MPLFPTVTAIAAPIPNGATYITTPHKLNNISIRLSQNPSMICFGFVGTLVSATAKMIDQNTMRSTSPLAAAATTPAGTACSISPCAVILVAVGTAAVAVESVGSVIPTPG